MNGDNLSVKTMTQLTGLNEHTLRAWERRYGAVRPKRGDNGRRVYSRHDVERLRTMTTLVERGFSIGRIATLGDVELAELLADNLSFDQPASKVTLPAALGAGGPRIAEFSRQIQGALSRHDLASIHAELQAARNLLGARSFAIELIAPLMQQVRAQSATGLVSIGQMHGLTSIVKAHLASITLSMVPASQGDYPRGMAFVMATMVGNHHEIGIMIAGVVAATHGAMVYYLGPNIPAAALAEAAIAFKADQVLIGCTAFAEGDLQPGELDYLKELDHLLPPSCALWLGSTVAPLFQSSRQRRSIKRLATLEDFDLALGH